MRFSVNFSEDVTGVSANDFALTTGGPAGQITSVTGSGSAYVVTVGNIVGGGTLGLHLANNVSIVDCTHKPLTADFTTGDAYTIGSLYWDADGGDSTNIGGTGTWDTASEYWRLGSSEGPLQAWHDGSDAVFEGTGGTVTLGSSTIHANQLCFNADGYVLTGESLPLGSSTLGYSMTWINVGSGSTATINAVLSDGAGIAKVMNKTGEGALVLGGVNTYTGGTTIYDGTLQLNNEHALGQLPSSLTVNDGTLDLNSHDITVSSLSGGGNITLGSGTLTVGGGNNTTYFGEISGTGDLIKNGSGTLTLSGVNDYTGGTVIDGGTLKVGSTSALGAATGGLTVNGGTLDLGGHSITVGSLDGTAGTITDSSSGSPTVLTVNISSGTSIYAGAIQDGEDRYVNLVKEGAGTLELSGDNSFHDTTVTDGTLILSGSNLYRSEFAGDTAVDGGTLQGTTNSLKGDITIAEGATVVFDQTFDGAFYGEIRSTGTDAGTLTKQNTGMLRLNNHSTMTGFTGAMNINGGTLYIGSIERFGSPAALNFNGGTLMLPAAIDIPISVAAVTLNAGGGTFDLADCTTVSASIEGSGRLTKTGPGTLTLNGSNGYAGGTVLGNGTLKVGSTSALGAATGGLTVNGGTLDLGGHSITVGSLDGTAGTITDSSSGSPTVLTVNISSGTSIYTGAIQDGEDRYVNLVKNGSGTLELSGDNSFHGTTVTGGTLILSGSNLYDSESAGDTTVNGGTLQGTTNSLKGLISIAEGATVVFDQTFDGAFYGEIRSTTTGAGTLTKQNTGTLRLNDHSTMTGFTGAMNINGGTLYIGSIERFGSPAALNFDGGTLMLPATIAIPASVAAVTLNAGGGTFDLADCTTISAPIGGSGGLTKTGPGTLTLNGSNGYTGGTVLDGGILKFGPASEVPVVGLIYIGCEGSLAVTGPSLYTTAMEWLTLIDPTSSGSLALISDSSESIDMAGYPALSLGAIGNVEYSGDLTPEDDTYRLGGGGGTLTVSGNLPDESNVPRSLVVTGNVTLSGSNDYTGGTVIDGGILKFGPASEVPVVGLIYICSEGSLAVTGPSLYTTAMEWLTLIDPTSSGSLALISYSSESIDMAGYPALSLGAIGNVEYSGVLTPEDDTYRLGGGGGTLTVSGNLPDESNVPRSLVVTGNVTLFRSNDYTGGTVIDGGTLKVGSTSALGAATGGLTVNGGTLDLGGHSITVGSLDGTAGTITDSSSGSPTVLTVNISSGTSIYAGAIQDGEDRYVNLVKEGAGTLELSGDNSFHDTTVTDGTLILSGSNLYRSEFAGDTAVDGGTLQGTTNSLKGLISIAEGATVVFDQTFDGAFYGEIRSTTTGTLTKQNTGMLRLGNDSNMTDFTGAMNINDGTLFIGSIERFGSPAALNFDGGTLMLPAAIDIPIRVAAVTLNAGGGTFDLADCTTISASIEGSGRLTKTGPGTLTLSGYNDYTGATTVDGGTLRLTTSHASTCSTITVNNGTLDGSGSVLGIVIASGGTLSPGGGILETNNLSLGAGSRYLVDIDGTIAGIEYDQTWVTGTVTLGGAVLDLDVSNSFVNGSDVPIVIIDNGSNVAVSGTFRDLPEGATVTLNGVVYHITYHYDVEHGYCHTAGNDVALYVYRVPSIATAPTASLNWDGTKGTLSVLGAVDNGESNLTYTWSVTASPEGITDTTFSSNNSHAAKNTLFTVHHLGDYTFTVTISDKYGVSISGSVDVTVAPVLTTIAITPSEPPPTFAVTQFTAVAKDQFGADLATQPAFTWAATAGSITSGGQYTPPASGGSVTVLASSDWLSSSVTFNVSNVCPTVATLPTAVPDLTGTIATLSVLGADDAGEANLTYTWQVTSMPAGAQAPRFANNGTNEAKETVVTFSQAGFYAFKVTITDAGGLPALIVPVTDVNVGQTLTEVWVSPSRVQLGLSETHQFVAVAYDQFGLEMASQPTFTWTATAGTISTGTGFFTAPGSSGPVTISAASGDVSGSSTVTVLDEAPIVVTPALASSSTVTGASTSLSILGDDDGGEANLTYTWKTTILPNGVSLPTFSASNGTNAGKTTGVTFSLAGTYGFEVTITDGGGQSVSRSLFVSVVTTMTSIAVSPSPTTLIPGDKQQFTAVAKDQFGRSLATQPVFTWSATDNAIGTTSGLYTAPYEGASVTVTVHSGSITGSCSFTVTNEVPRVENVATAADNSVTNEHTTLSVLGEDNNGESNLTYTWVTTTLPVAASQPTFAQNGTNTAKTTDVTFTSAGVYAFTVTITDRDARSVTSTVGVTVVQTSSSVDVSPATVALDAGGTQQFSATAYDQFGYEMATQPTFTWNATAGGGQIDEDGLYTAPNDIASTAPVDETVTVQTGAFQATSTVTVTNHAPKVATAPTSATATVTGTTTTLSVLGDDDAGESNLIYTWEAGVYPLDHEDPEHPEVLLTSAPTFSVNKTNDAKDTVVTFSTPGTYAFNVTITDKGGLWVNTLSMELQIYLDVTVTPTVTTVAISPATQTLSGNAGGTLDLSATASDQFGLPVSQPEVTWSTTAGTIGTNGVLHAPNTMMPVTVTVQSGGVSASRSVAISNPDPTLSARLGDNWIEPLWELSLGDSATQSLPVYIPGSSNFSRLSGSAPFALSNGFVLPPTASFTFGVAVSGSSSGGGTLTHTWDGYEASETDAWGLTITETCNQGVWTYDETFTSTYTITTTGSNDFSSSTDGEYGYSFHASSDTTAFTYTVKASATAHGPDNVWRQETINTDTFTYGNHSGSGSTTATYVDSHAYSYAIDGGNVGGTASDSGSHVISYGFSITDPQGSGSGTAWNEVIDSTNSSYAGTGNYSDGAVGGSQSESGGDSSSYDYVSHYSLTAGEQTWRATSGSGGSSGGGFSDLSHVESGPYSDAVDQGTLIGSLSQNDSDTSSYTYGTSATYSSSTGVWTVTGSKSQSDDSESHYSYSGECFGANGACNESGADDAYSHSTTGYAVVSDAWQVSSGNGTSSGTGFTYSSYSETDLYSTDTGDGTIDGTENESGADNTYYEYSTTSTYSSGGWAHSGAGYEHQYGNSHYSYAGDGDYSASDCGPYADSDCEGHIEGSQSESGRDDDSYNYATWYGMSADGAWQVTAASGGSQGSGETHSSYSGDGDYQTSSSSETDDPIEGTFDENGHDNTSYHYNTTVVPASDGWTETGTRTESEDGASLSSYLGSGDCTDSTDQGDASGTRSESGRDESSYSYSTSYTLSSDGTWEVTGGSGESESSGETHAGRSVSGIYSGSFSGSYGVDESDNTSYDYSTTDNYSSGGWNSSGSGSETASGSSSSSYSRTHDDDSENGQSTSTTDEDGDDEDDYNRTTSYQLDDEGSWQVSSETASGSTTSSYTRAYHSDSDDGHSSSTIDEYSGDDDYHDYHYTKNYEPDEDGNWQVSSGSGSETCSGSTSSSYTRTYDYESNDGQSTSSTEETGDDADYYSYTKNYELDEDGDWQASNGSGDTSGTGHAETTFTASGSTSMVFGVSASGTFSRSDTDSTSHDYSTTATFADGQWTVTGGHKTETQEGSSTNASSGSGSNSTSDGNEYVTQNGSFESSYSYTENYDPDENGNWDLADGDGDTSGSGTSESTYSRQGEYDRQDRSLDSSIEYATTATNDGTGWLENGSHSESESGSSTYSYSRTTHPGSDSTSTVTIEDEASYTFADSYDIVDSVRQATDHTSESHGSGSYDSTCSSSGSSSGISFEDTSTDWRSYEYTTSDDDGTWTDESGSTSDFSSTSTENGRTTKRGTDSSQSHKHTVEYVDGEIDSDTDEFLRESTGYEKTSRTDTSPIQRNGNSLSGSSTLETAHTISSSSSRAETTSDGHSTSASSESHFSDEYSSKYSYSYAGSSAGWNRSMSGEDETSYTYSIDEDSSGILQTRETSGTSKSSSSDSKDNGANQEGEDRSSSMSYDWTATKNGSGAGSASDWSESGSLTEAHYDNCYRSYQLTTKSTSSSEGEVYRTTTTEDHDISEVHSNSATNGWSQQGDSKSSSARSSSEVSYSESSSSTTSDSSGVVASGTVETGSYSGEWGSSTTQSTFASGAWQATAETTTSSGKDSTHDFHSESNRCKLTITGTSDEFIGMSTSYGGRDTDFSFDRTSSSSGSGSTETGQSVSGYRDASGGSFSGQGIGDDFISDGAVSGPLDIHREYNNWSGSHVYNNLVSGNTWQRERTESASGGSGKGDYSWSGEGHYHEYSPDCGGTIHESASGEYSYGYSGSATDWASGSSTASGSGSYSSESHFSYNYFGSGSTDVAGEIVEHAEVTASGNGRADSQESEEACMSGGTWWISDEDSSCSYQQHYSGTCNASGTVYNISGSDPVARGDYQFSGTGSAEKQKDGDGRTVSSSSGAGYAGYSMSDSQDVTSYDWDENWQYTPADPETPTETTAESWGWIHRADESSSSYPPSSDNDYNPRMKWFAGVPQDIAEDGLQYPGLHAMGFSVNNTLEGFSYFPSKLPWWRDSMLASSSSLSLVSSEGTGTNSLESAGTDSSAASSLSQSSLAAISRTPSTFTESSVAGSLWRAASASFASSPVHTPPATLGAFAPSFAADSLPSSFGPMSAESRISAVRAKLGGSASATSMSFAAVDSLFRLGSGSLDDATDSQSEIGVRHFDSAGRLSSIIDLNGGATRFTYDAAGNLASLTDPVQNTTSWLYDQSRVTQETDALGASRHFTYDNGNLSRYVDRNGQIRQYQYVDGNVSSETWYANGDDADAQQNAANTIQYTRDSAGRITAESDNNTADTYVYNDAGQITSTTESSVDGPTVTLDYQYNTAGERTQMAATIGSTADFVDDYVYDSLGRVVSVSEHGVTGGNAVALKEIDLAYNTAGQIVSIDRYENGQLAVEGDYSYDSNARLIGLVYHQGDTILNSYAWTYSGDSSIASASPLAPWSPTGGLMPVHDTAGVVTALMSGGLAGVDLLTSCTSNDGTANYSYDPTGQLTAVGYTGGQAAESYTWDANGNRTNAGYVIGAGNRLLSDGIYTYCYDSEGDRTAKFIDANHDGVLDTGDTNITQYTWDNRNRLVEVTDRASFGGEPTQIVDYSYDAENRWVGEAIDSNGDGVVDHQLRFAYDGNQIVLEFEKDGAGAVSVADLSHRYLWQPNAVDQLMADERTHLDAGNIVTDELLWALTDHLGTVRDLARSDGTTTSVVNHIVYESFGTIVSQSDSTQGTLFGFTGRPLDTATGLQNNWHRVYDSITGGWLSTDPLSFTAGDANTVCYVGNSPTNATDPTGLATNVGYAEAAIRILYYTGGQLPKTISPTLANRLMATEQDGAGVSVFKFSDYVQVTAVHGIGVLADNANAAMVLVIDLPRTDGKCDAAIYRLSSFGTEYAFEALDQGVAVGATFKRIESGEEKLHNAVLQFRQAQATTQEFLGETLIGHGFASELAEARLTTALSRVTRSGAQVGASSAAIDAELAAQQTLISMEGELGSHFLQKHSPMVKLVDLLRRATTGIPNEVGKFVKADASRFRNYVDMKAVIDKAVAAYSVGGSQGAKNIVITMPKVIGEGYLKNSGVFTTTTKAIVRFNKFGKIYTAYPLLR